MTPKLKKYYKACDELAKEFAKKYYSDDWDDEVYWIGGGVGEICSIGEEFLDMTEIAKIMEWEFTVDEYRDWYNWRDDWSVEGDNLPLNLEHYIRIYREDKSKLPIYKNN